MTEEERLYFRNYQRKNREKINARNRAHYAAHRDEEIAKRHSYDLDHKDHRNVHLRVCYKKKVESVATRPRPEFCEACGGNGKRVLVWDHNHETGVFRGWLCHGCNLSLGHMKESPARLRALANYIENGGPEE